MRARRAASLFYGGGEPVVYGGAVVPGTGGLAAARTRRAHVIGRWAVTGEHRTMSVNWLREPGLRLQG